jgi:hypothetical protein
MESKSAGELVDSRWQGWFSPAIRFIVAPLILLLSGFYTADFLLSGAYTWPKSSRTVVLTVTVAILSYEFVYKEAHAAHGQTPSPWSTVLYSCVIPYGLGVLALLAMAVR